MGNALFSLNFICIYELEFKRNKYIYNYFKSYTTMKVRTMLDIFKNVSIMTGVPNLIKYI